VGSFTFSFRNDQARCTKNEFGLDYRAEIDAWFYMPNWPDPDMSYSAHIEIPNFDRLPSSVQATGAGPNTIHLLCTNGWIDLEDNQETTNIISRFTIGFVDFDNKEVFIGYLVDSLKLELRYNDYYYQRK
jgi:hypothetical protein